MSSMRNLDVSSAIGPGSDLLPNSEIDNYAPVSRNGEVTQNALIDAHLYNEVISKELKDVNIGTGIEDERAPEFHQFASVDPGVVCLYKKNRAFNHGRSIGAESAVPVLGMAQCYSVRQNQLYGFAGICRSKNIRDYDDVANGMKGDEYFTLAIGGPATILNNGCDVIQIGDAVEWTFQDLRTSKSKKSQIGKKAGPRRVQVRTAKGSRQRVFGRALSFARKDERFDVLITNGSM